MSLIFWGILALEIHGFFKTVENPIAILSQNQGTVKVLPRGFGTWDYISEGWPFQFGDTVSTSEKSTGKIAFLTGEELDLGENSMVLISKFNNEIHLNLFSGSGILRLPPGHASKIKTSTNHPLIETLSTATPNDQRFTTLPADFTLDEKQLNPTSPPLSSSGSPITASSKPQYQSPVISWPQDNSFLDFNQKLNFDLQWSCPKDGEDIASFEVEISPLNSIERHSNLFRTQKQSYTLSNISDGRYYWSVRGITHDGKRTPASEMHYFEVRSHRALRGPQPKSANVTDESE